MILLVYTVLCCTVLPHSLRCRYASDVIPRLVPILSDLSKQLGDFDSLSREKNDFTDGQLVSGI